MPYKNKEDYKKYYQRNREERLEYQRKYYIIFRRYQRKNFMKKNPETQNITKFIQSVSEKNYAAANEQLKKTIENKLINRISKFKNINIFKDE